MKHYVFAALLTVAATASFAEQQTTRANAEATSESQSVASTDGNAQSLQLNSYAPRTQTIKNTPSMMGPNLTTSNDTCMGSSSGAISAPGIGVALGSTWTDTNCVRLKNARELWNMGMRAASVAMLCNDAEIRSALEVTGYKCPTAENKSTKATTIPATSAGSNAADYYGPKSLY